MNKKYYKKGLIVAVATIGSVLAFATIATASHSWGAYHFARTANPSNLQLGDNVSGVWDSYLTTTSTMWNASTVLSTTVVLGQSNVKNCRPTLGRVEVCNKAYGSNGWLGIASISVNGAHITQGTVKLNDTYFNTTKYNTPAWRQFVMCQEVGHTFGLDHQDENFTNANLGTCMDYTNNPGTNQYPNLHDFSQLEIIYAHLDSITTMLSRATSLGATRAEEIDTENPKEWGKEIRKSRDGRSSLHERNLGNGQKIFTFVIWAE